MRTRKRAAHGAAIFYVLAASTALACPVASDLNGAGIRFIGTDGADEVHRRLDAERIEIDYVAPGAPISRSILAHGVYTVWFGDIDAAGAVIPDSETAFTRAEKLGDLPVPVPGLTWSSTQGYADANGTSEEPFTLTVGPPTTWALGACAYNVLNAQMVYTYADGATYTETLMYLTDLGTAVLVATADDAGTSAYVYSDVRVNGQ